MIEILFTSRDCIINFIRSGTCNETPWFLREQSVGCPWVWGEPQGNCSIGLSFQGFLFSIKHKLSKPRLYSYFLDNYWILSLNELETWKYWDQTCWQSFLTLYIWFDFVENSDEPPLKKMKSEVLEDDASIYTNPIEKDTEEVQFILGLLSPCCVYCYFTVVFTVILLYWRTCGDNWRRCCYIYCNLLWQLL